MNIAKISVFLVAATLSLSTAYAHSTKDRSKEPKTPQCDSMKDMNHAEMDMNDPLTQALMRQCAADEKTKDSKELERSNRNPMTNNSDHSGHH